MGVDVIMGIQIGTKIARVDAFSLSGIPMSAAFRKIKIYHSAPHHSEIDAAELWQNICECLQECFSKHEDMHVLSVCVTSVGESNVLIDHSGHPIGSVITWYDQRATDQARMLQRTIGERRLYEITGQFISPKFGICKTMWTRDNIPEAFTKAYKCLTLHDYIIYKLTGKFCTDYSMASRMMFFDIERLCWSDEILEMAGLSKDLLPQVLPGGTKAGTVTKEASRLTRLQAGLPVFVGGHDHACAAVAVNIFDDDIMLDSMGSAETNVVALHKRPDIEQGFNNQIAIYPHFGTKLFRGITSIQACGAIFDWFTSAFNIPNNAQTDVALNDWLFSAAENCKTESNSCLFIPHIRGLQEAASAKGAFLGIDETCDCNTFICAMMEGLCFEFKRRTMACENAIGKTYSVVRAVGTYSLSPGLMCLKASISGKKLETIGFAEAVSFGAALLGAIGSEIFSQNSLHDIFCSYVDYLPEYKKVKSYEKKFNNYIKAHELLMGLN